MTSVKSYDDYDNLNITSLHMSPFYPRHDEKLALDRSPDSLAQYLSSRGFKVIPFKSGDICYRLKSPWNPEEKTPSAYIYASGVLKCYATGKSGNILTFRKMFGGSFSLSQDWTPPPPKPKKPFPGHIPSYLLDLTEEEKKQVTTYAASRCMFEGYLCGATKFDGVRTLCVVFPHEDQGAVVGAKFRSITATKDKMRMRGVPGLYVLSSGTPTFVALIEGEANANSLWEYYRSVGIGAIVVSSGGVSNIPQKLPFNLPVKVFLDYDGDDARYSERIQKWSHLGKAIKIRLPKGEDINSLWCKGKIGLVEKLLV